MGQPLALQPLQPSPVAPPAVAPAGFSMLWHSLGDLPTNADRSINANNSSGGSTSTGASSSTTTGSTSSGGQASIPASGGSSSSNSSSSSGTSSGTSSSISSNSLPSPWLRECVLQDAYARGLVAIGTRGGVIERTVTYNTYGHSFALDTGAETGILFDSNLGILAREARALTTRDTQMPSVFWVSNPNNTLRWVRNALWFYTPAVHGRGG